jgi:diguanylate cyclase (GGDEF)-like protein/PAS domain S-box-containing protein
LINVLIAGAYLALAELPALAFRGASPLWPPAALAAFVALRWGWRAAPGLFVGSLLANLLASRLGPGAATIASLGNVAAPLLGRALLQRLGGTVDAWWESPRAELVFLLAMGGTQSLLSAAVGTGGMVLFGRLPHGAVDALLGWTVGDASAVTMLTPLLQIGWRRWRGGDRPPLGPPAQIAAAFALVLAIWALAIGAGALAPVQRTGLLGLIMFPLLGSVFALDAAVTAALLAFTFVLLTASAAVGLPIVSNTSSAQTVVALEFFLLAVGAAVRFASALQHARRGALRRLEQQAARLDTLARERADTLLAQREQFHAQIVQLSELTGVLAAVNQMIAQAHDDAGLLQRFCAQVAELRGVALAWIGRPDDSGRFAVLASAGQARAYLDGIAIVADPGSALGQGPTGRAWREQQAVFVGDLQAATAPAPWRERQRAFGILASASLPLFRGGRIWAVLNLYLTTTAAFEAELRKVVERIAADISIGLDRLDAIRTERAQSRINAALLSNLSVGVTVMRYPERVFEHVNERLLEMAGAADLAELSTHPAEHFYDDPADFARVTKLAREVLESGRGALQDVRYRRLDGTALMMDTSGVRLDLGDGVQRILWTQIDVSERHRQAQQLRAATASRAALLANTVAAIDMVRYPERVITEVNQGFLDITGYASAEEVVGQSTAIIYAQVTESQRMAELSQRILEVGDGSLDELEVRRHDGTLVYLDVHGRRLDGDDPQHPLIVWTSIDVTRRRALTEELKRLAMFDPLTGLPNRRAVENHIGRAIERAKRHGSAIAVGMIDLDDFKPVNDRLGHEAGDRLLQQLGARLQQVMRGIDLVGRFGGDEFVIVLEDLTPDAVAAQLEQILARVHEAVETPFAAGDGPGVYIEMSLGLAVYPIDSDQPDALLRAADAAMYQAKKNKVERTRWWLMGAGAPSVTEAPFDPFSEESQKNLAGIAAQMHEIADEFTAAFYDELGKRDEGAKILAALTDDELAELKAIQAGHFAFLLAPSTRAHQIAARGLAVGRIHALSGLSAATMSDAYALYRELLRWHLDAWGMQTRVRYRTLRAADERLQIEMQAELDAMQSVVNQYNESLAHPGAAQATMVELVQRELDTIAALPGIVAVLVMRPQADGLVHAELAAGERADAVLKVLGDPSMMPSLDAGSPAGQGLVRAAWVSGNIERIDSYGREPRSMHWAQPMLALGVRSMVAIPVQGARSQFVLAILGGFRSQFSANWVQTFLVSLQSRWIGMMSRTASTLEVTEPDSVARYRELLYARRLSMYLQPVVDTRSGEVLKVEALARLRDGDEVVAPGRFLPALRAADLDVLFRAGLDASLAWLRDAHARGRSLGISLNLPPSTLVHPDCARWIDDGLRGFALPPQALTLELLESQEFDDVQHDRAIRALGNLGVMLAIDDLGSGYSSLSRLASLPFDVIKVDQSITAEVTRAPLKVLSLIRTVVQIGKDLDRDVIVEGAETHDVLDAVTVLGAHHVQGYAIARPMPPEEFFDWERRHAASWKPVGGVDTWLGALAYAWLYMHSDGGRYPTPHAQCPLTRFLAAQGQAQGDAAVWHAQLHGDAAPQDRRALQARLIDWLARRIG